MKRALLIAGGTVGGLGAVLAITPPQIGQTDSSLSLGSPAAPGATQTPASTAANPQPAASKSAAAGKPSASKPAATQSAAPAATQSARALPPVLPPYPRLEKPGFCIASSRSKRLGKFPRS